MYQQLCAAVEGTVVGGLLSGVKSAHCDDFYQRYLHDFVRLVHMCNQKDLEFELQEYEVRCEEFVQKCEGGHLAATVINFYFSLLL